MRNTTHYDMRMAQRGFNTRFTDILIRHGNLIEQSGQSYALALSDSAEIHALRKEFAEQEQECFFRIKKLDRRRRRAKIQGAVEEAARLELVISTERTELKELKSMKKSVKEGFVIFGALKEADEQSLVTIAHHTHSRQIRGYNVITEA
ncbi:MAG: hypothetical protein ABJ308_01825 [Halieaceae bacterium]